MKNSEVRFGGNLILISYVFHNKNALSDFKRFIKSINLYPPPKNTILVISVKACSKTRILEMRKVLKKSPLSLQVKFHEFIDFGYANGTYYLLNEIYNPKVMICMTATSQFNHKNWFNLLTLPLNNNRIGIVGSMLSYVSLKTNYYELMEVIIKNKLRIRLTTNQKFVGTYYNISFKKVFFNFGSYDSKPVKFLISQIFKLHKFKHPTLHRDLYPDFPNPHLRTTGFAIRGRDLKKVITKIPESKIDELLLESGHYGYSMRLRQLGYKVLVCTPDNTYLDVYSRSTFIKYEEFIPNSVIIDMHVRKYQGYSKARKIAIQYLRKSIRDKSFLEE